MNEYGFDAIIHNTHSHPLAYYSLILDKTKNPLVNFQGHDWHKNRAWIEIEGIIGDRRGDFVVSEDWI